VSLADVRAHLAALRAALADEDEDAEGGKPVPAPEDRRSAPVIPIGALPRPKRTAADTPAHGLACVASAATTVPR
jgi:hypothetical protein